MTFIERILPCRLTDDEKIEHGVELGKLILQNTELELERKQVNQKYNDRIKSNIMVINDMGAIQESGIENRSIKCELTYHSPKNGMKQIVRMDTQEVIEESEMNRYDNEKYAEEMQLSLKFD